MKLICIDSQEKENYMPILSYDSVRIINMVTGQDRIMILKGVRGDDSEIFMFDGIRGCVFANSQYMKNILIL